MADDLPRLADYQCLRIVLASISPDRVLGGQDGYDGGAPDVLLTTVREIVREREAQVREEIATAIEAEMTQPGEIGLSASEAWENRQIAHFARIARGGGTE